MIRATINNASSAKYVCGPWTPRFIAMVPITKYIVEVPLVSESIPRVSFLLYLITHITSSPSFDLLHYIVDQMCNLVIYLKPGVHKRKVFRIPLHPSIIQHCSWCRSYHRMFLLNCHTMRITLWKVKIVIISII